MDTIWPALKVTARQASSRAKAMNARVLWACGHPCLPTRTRAFCGSCSAGRNNYRAAELLEARLFTGLSHGSREKKILLSDRGISCRSHDRSPRGNSAIFGLIEKTDHSHRRAVIVSTRTPRRGRENRRPHPHQLLEIAAGFPRNSMDQCSKPDNWLFNTTRHRNETGMATEDPAPT